MNNVEIKPVKPLNPQNHLIKDAILLHNEKMVAPYLDKAFEWNSDEMRRAFILLNAYANTDNKKINKLNVIWTLVKLSPTLIHIAGVLMFGKFWDNPKTTIASIVKAAFGVLAALGVSTGHITEAAVSGFLFFGLEIVQGFLTKDK